MNDLADEFGLVVAYPHQPRRANASGCWNWFDKRHQNRGSGEPARLAGLAQTLAREFGVRKERVFAAGLSAGGAMAEVLAATYADVFDAVGVHSGLPYKSAVDVPSAFAAMKGSAAVDSLPDIANDSGCRKIVFHGGGDATVHPMNGEQILEQAECGQNPLRDPPSIGRPIAGASATRSSRIRRADRSSSTGLSRTAGMPGSAEIFAERTRKASGSTLPESWFASS